LNSRDSLELTTALGVGSGATIKSTRELESMREAGRVVALTIRRVIAALEPGVTTDELDRLARKEIKSHGAKPSFLGYAPHPDIEPFPATICVSINEEIVHGIPGSRVLKDGDLVSVDVGAVVDGFHGDSAVTEIVGNGTDEKRALLDTTRRALELGIEAATPGGRIGDISAAIEAHVEKSDYGLVIEYTGHGIGRRLHEPPSVPNHGKFGQGHLLRPGMTLAIEPMVNMGGWKTKPLNDGWTVVTADGSISAHFEHTIAITEIGTQILTSA